MSAVWSVVLMFCLAVCADAQTRTLAVAAGVPPGMDAASTATLQRELQRLLQPASISVSWQGAGAVNTAQEFERIVVGSFAGRCDVDTLPVYSAGPKMTRVLGDSVVHHERVLPYFRVDCGLLVRTLSPVLEPLNVPMRRALLERAMARVIAHEIYHILAQTTEHGDSGIAKSSFSLEDLVAQHVEFNPTSLARMRPGVPSVVPPLAIVQVNTVRCDPSSRLCGAIPQPGQSLLRARSLDGASSGSRSAGVDMLLPQ